MRLSNNVGFLVHIFLAALFCDAHSEMQKSVTIGENTAFINDFSRIVRQKLPKTTCCSKNNTKSSFKYDQSQAVGMTSRTSVTRGSSITSLLKEAPTPLVRDSKASGESDRLNCTFVPFEEWRINNKNEKPSERTKKSRSSGQGDQCEGDSIGDDMEFDIGFFSGGVTDKAQEEQGEEPEGTVYKHKFNFASLDCAATIVKTNSEASGAASILIENKDKYLLNLCSASSQFITVELCQDILVEEIGLANFEYFSSTFSKLRFSVSDQYPVGKNGWRVLGEFEAENSRNLQKFAIENPRIWAKYLQIEVLSHHDNEYYCPISLLRVHGKTMMDDFKMENSKSSSPTEVADGEKPEESSQATCEDAIVEQCDLWPSINPENITILPQFPEYFKTCRSKLKTLKFEEFLRNLNESSCPPQYPKDPINIASSSSSSSQTGSFSTEESIFKNMMKRLSSLESNTTLTVRYIEEQGRLLSNSFEQLEKTQSIKFENLIVLFNETIMDNLNVLRVFANQLKDQSVRILEEQKLNTDQFTTKNMNRLESLEEELKIQRTFIYAIVCSVLLMLVYLFLNKGAFRFDEVLKKDTALSVNPLIPSK